MVPDVFVCHSPADAALAEKVREFLETQGIHTWVASRHILLGEELADSLLRGVETCPVVVLIFSQSANDSEAVRKQVERALAADKVLIPFRIENVPPTGHMEVFLRRRYWHEASLPPLERHLEELARMLKPLTQQRKVVTMDDASISRTLPSRASILRRSASLEEQSRSRRSTTPLRVSFKFDEVIVARRSALCECTVENEGSTTLEQIEIIVESGGLKRVVSNALGDLSSGETRHHSLEMEPARSGNFVLQVSVKVRDGAKQLAFAGSRSLVVAEPPSNSDLMSATQNLPQRAENPAAAREDTPDNFKPMNLSLDYEVGVEAVDLAKRPQALRIPDAFLNGSQAGTLLKLEPEDVPGGMPYQDVRLVARPSFGLGRSQEESDFLLWFWPRNEVHDTKTRRISKKHCTLTTERGKFYVTNTAAASLTTLDGQDLSGPESVTLERRGILNLSGIYSLDVTRFPADCPQGPVILNLGDWKGADAGTDTTSTGGSGSMRFVPQTPNVLPQNSTWLLTDGTFGTSRVNPIILEAAGLAEIQGRFHHYRGTFWIENFVDNNAVQVDAHVVVPGSIVPLAGGQTLKLGEKSFYVSLAV